MIIYFLVYRFGTLYILVILELPTFLSLYSLYLSLLQALPSIKCCAMLFRKKVTLLCTIPRNIYRTVNFLHNPSWNNLFSFSKQTCHSQKETWHLIYKIWNNYILDKKNIKGFVNFKRLKTVQQRLRELYLSCKKKLTDWKVGCMVPIWKMKESYVLLHPVILSLFLFQIGQRLLYSVDQTVL